MNLKTTPSFSVVIPAYNAADTIQRSIDSVLTQTFLPVEIIVVDDGSEDNTETVVNSYGDKVKYIKQVNQGSAVARQVGSQTVVADYIVYLDADDWWPLDKLDELRQILDLEDVEFLLGDLNRAITSPDKIEYLPRNTSFFPESERIWKSTPAQSAWPELYVMAPKEGLALLLSGFPVFPSAMMVKKTALDKIGGWDSRFRRCQDFDVGLRLARVFPLYFYNKIQSTLGIHAGNSDEDSYLIKQTLGDIKVLHAHVEDATDDRHYQTKALAALAKKYCALAYVYRRIDELEKALESYKGAFALPGRKFHALSRIFMIRAKQVLSLR